MLLRQFETTVQPFYIGRFRNFRARLHRSRPNSLHADMPLYSTAVDRGLLEWFRASAPDCSAKDAHSAPVYAGAAAARTCGGTAIERAYPLTGAPSVYVDWCPAHRGYSTSFQREGLHPDDEVRDRSDGGPSSR